MESKLGWMELNIRGFGKMISNMGKGYLLIRTGALIKEHGKMENQMAKEHIFGQMVQDMTGNFMMVSSTGMVHTKVAGIPIQVNFMEA